MSEARPEVVALSVRIPHAAHRALKALAARELSSVNREVNIAIRAHLDASRKGTR